MKGSNSIITLKGSNDENRVLFLSLPFLLFSFAFFWNVAFATRQVQGSYKTAPTPSPTLLPTASNESQNNSSMEILLSPTIIPTPQQGCVSGARIETCAFYTQQGTDDGGSSVGWPDQSTCFDFWHGSNEIYFGFCGDSGIRFPNVSFSSGKEILSSFIEFTADGPYTNAMKASIYGEASTNPEPYDYGHNVVNRATLLQVADWEVPSGNTMYNMGDTWSLGEIRRTPDLTSILSAIKGQIGWSMGNPVSFIFKPKDSTDLGHRRIIAYERASTDPNGWAKEHLVVRLGTVPNHSISYYWYSAVPDNNSPTSFSLDKTALEAAGAQAALKNQPAFVILDFGPPRVSATYPGTNTFSADKEPITAIDIADGAKKFIDGFWNGAKGKKNASLYLAIGTNNAGDLYCPHLSQYFAPHATAWGNMVNDVGAYITTKRYQSKVSVAGANDIESWGNWTVVCNGTPISGASVDHTITWVQAFASAAPTYKMFNFGSVDNNTGGGLGTTQWGADAIWLLSWGISNAYPFPEIYFDQLASQWATIARYSAVCTNCMPEQSGLSTRNMKFFGALTMYNDADCLSTLSPKQGWLKLYRDLAVDVNTDYNLNSDPQVFLYSSDINPETNQVCEP